MNAKMNTELVELAPASDEDIPGIAALMNKAYRGTQAASSWSTGEKYLTGDRTSEKLLREDLARSPNASLLIWRNGAGGSLKGSVWVEAQENNVWYLGSLAVDLDQQNSGLGRTLLSSAERWVQKQGGARVQMAVVNVREALISWYLRRGYGDTGRRQPFPYGDDRFGTPQRDDLGFVILEKELSGPASAIEPRPQD